MTFACVVTWHPSDPSSKICLKYRFSKALGSVSILLVNVSKLMFLSLTLRLFSSCVSQRWSHQQSRQCWQEWFDIERIWAHMAFTYDGSLVSHGQWQASLSVAVLVRREEWVVLRGAGGAGQCRTVQHHGKTSPKDPKKDPQRCTRIGITGQILNDCVPFASRC